MIFILLHRFRSSRPNLVLLSLQRLYSGSKTVAHNALLLNRSSHEGVMTIYFPQGEARRVVAQTAFRRRSECGRADCGHKGFVVRVCLSITSVGTCRSTFDGDTSVDSNTSALCVLSGLTTRGLVSSQRPTYVALSLRSCSRTSTNLTSSPPSILRSSSNDALEALQSITSSNSYLSK